MQETIKRNLSYKEELTLAAFFSNVQKFSCLAEMPHFRKELFTEPVLLYGNGRAPLVTLLSCFKILYSVPGHEDLQKRNDAIIGIIRDKTGLVITDAVDLSEFNPSGTGDILRISDYSRLYSWTLWFRNEGYGQGKEDWSVLQSHYNSVMNYALREQHLKTLEKKLSEEEILRMRAEAEAKDKERREKRPYHGRPLPPEVKEFIDSIDLPGAILAIFDEGKAFARTMIPEPPYLLHADIVQYILTATRHITIRVGGYSDRVARVVMDVAEKLGCEPCRVEHLSMRDYDFNPESPFVKYAEQYDFKYFSMGGEARPMVYWYVNKIDTGFYEEDGSFVPFYSNDRGLQALTDVAMVRGYEDIRPATAALYTDSGRGRGDILFFGPTSHSDRKSRGGSQRKLFEDAGIKFLNLYDVKRS